MEPLETVAGPAVLPFLPSWVASWKSGWGLLLETSGPQMPVSPAGCEEERGAACGCAVRILPGRKAVTCGSVRGVEQLMNFGQAALVAAAHPAPEAPRPARACISSLVWGCVTLQEAFSRQGFRVPLLCNPGQTH